MKQRIHFKKICDSRLIDILFCLIILPLMLFAFPVERWWGTYPIYFASFACWLYVTYFTYTYYILPRLFCERKQWQSALIVLALSVGITYFFASYHITSPIYYLRQQYPTLVPVPRWGMRQNQQAIWLHYILVSMFCVAVGLLNETYRKQLAYEEMEHARNKAELAFYKAQINPHFLFNTLNTIYGLLITQSDQTEAAMERFINLIKYMHVNAHKDFIPLADEVKYIQQYIDLQKLRLTEQADVSFTYEIEETSTLVPPMMLITFVENAFKYGISSNDPCYVHIRLEQQGGRWSFEVENSRFERMGANTTPTGLDNCRRRLELLYPHRHQLEVDTTQAERFRIRLTIQTQPSC